MHVLFLNAGNETGGGMHHILQVMEELNAQDEGKYTLGLFEEKEFYKRALKRGITTVCFQQQKKFSVKLLRAIIDFIQLHQVTIVHTHGPRANVLMQIIRVFVNVKWISTVHSNPLVDFETKGMYGKFLSRLHLRALRSADQLISVCDAFHPLLLQQHISQKKISTVHNGICFEAEKEGRMGLNERKKHGFKPDDFLFLQVARLEEVKGHELALIALKNIVENIEGRDCHLLLVGDGILKEQLQEFTKDLQIESYVHFYGNQMDVTPFYEMANVSLLTSTSESFPYVWLESAKFKKPIITTKVGDAAYLIKENENGWKVAVNDVDGLIRAMTEAASLVETDELMKRGENLYTYAKKHFSLQHCTEKICAVYDKVLLE